MTNDQSKNTAPQAEKATIQSEKAAVQADKTTSKAGETASKADESIARPSDETLRRKANHYLVCLIDTCPLREQCLRWLVGQYADPDPYAYNAVNPRNPKIGGEHCAMFRPCRRVLMKRGFKDLFREMPGYKEYNIRHSLIATWGRKRYFEMRRGDRLITPDEQDTIAHACRHHGWDGPIVYGGEQEEWLW